MNGVEVVDFKSRPDEAAGALAAGKAHVRPQDVARGDAGLLEFLACLELDQIEGIEIEDGVHFAIADFGLDCGKLHSGDDEFDVAVIGELALGGVAFGLGEHLRFV